MPIKRLAISCLFAFAVFLSSFGGTLRAAGPGFAAMAGEPGAVEAGFRLPPRSALVPYPSREEALAGGTSSYVIPLEEWQRDSVPEGVRYTARFKVRYAWDNRAVLLRVEDVPSSFGIEVNGEAAGIDHLRKIDPPIRDHGAFEWYQIKASYPMIDRVKRNCHFE